MDIFRGKELVSDGESPASSSGSAVPSTGFHGAVIINSTKLERTQTSQEIRENIRSKKKETENLKKFAMEQLNSEEEQEVPTEILKEMELTHKKNPKDTEAAMCYASGLLRSKNHDKKKQGLSILKELHSHDPNHREVAYFLALAHFRLNQLERAKEITEALLLLEPNNRQGIALKAIIKEQIQAVAKRFLVLVDDGPEAIWAVQRVIELAKPDDDVCLLTVLSDLKIDKEFVAHESIADELKEERVELIQRTSRKILEENEIKFYSISEVGNVRELLARICDSEGADFVVFGLPNPTVSRLGRAFVNPLPDFAIHNIPNCDVIVAKNPH